VSDLLQRLGRFALGAVVGLGATSFFGGHILAVVGRPPLRLRTLVRQVFDAGVRSLLLICASGFVVGVSLGLQFYIALSRFGAEGSLGALIGVSLVRELGPVLTALLVTGRAGSAKAAEIGAMVTTEQLDGLRMMAIDPVDFVVAPRALALALVMPMLTALFILFAMAGGYLIGVGSLGLDSGTYYSSLQAGIDFETDVAGCFLKSAIFGILLGVIATYRGYTSAPTTEGVSAATTSTVVTASVCILISNYLITAIWWS
jgi:phospholipid/cholesterol/gamma-HCH transport system permease protein